MAVHSTDPETPVRDVSADSQRQHTGWKSSRRKPSFRKLMSGYMASLLSSRHLFAAGLALFLIVGFIGISLMNGVFAPETQKWQATETELRHVTPRVRNTAEDELAPDFSAQVLKLARVDEELFSTVTRAMPAAPEPASTSSQALASTPVSVMTPASASTSASETASAPQAQLVGKTLPTSWSTADLSSMDLLPVISKQPVASEITAAERNAVPPDTYVVNEGGSLWRVGRRFIDDEVLLDRLIDNLADKGMNVRSVRPGVAFVVHDLGSEGMLVTVDNRGDTYESFIFQGSVTTSVNSGNQIAR